MIRAGHGWWGDIEAAHEWLMDDVLNRACTYPHRLALDTYVTLTDLKASSIPLWSVYEDGGSYIDCSLEYGVAGWAVEVGGSSSSEVELELEHRYRVLVHVWPDGLKARVRIIDPEADEVLLDERISPEDIEHVSPSRIAWGCDHAGAGSGSAIIDTAGVLDAAGLYRHKHADRMPPA